MKRAAEGTVPSRNAIPIGGRLLGVVVPEGWFGDDDAISAGAQLSWRDAEASEAIEQPYCGLICTNVERSTVSVRPTLSSAATVTFCLPFSRALT